MSLRTARRLDGVERTLIRRIFDSAPPGAINLGLGQPDLDTPPSVAMAGVTGIAAGRTGYTSTAGDPALRAAVARRYPSAASGPDDVVITVGSQQALYLACLGLLDPGDELLYPDPGYPAYPAVADLVGARATAYPLRPERGFRLDSADVESCIGPATRLVILSSPSNPTGACDAPAELRRLLAALDARGIAWLSDEVYAGLRYVDGWRSPSELAAGTGLIVSGLSKEMSMTGWRIGWVIAPAGVAERLVAAQQYLVTCAPSISQAAALGAFSARGVAEREIVVRRFARRRALMGDELACLPGVRFEPPDGAFYYFVDVSAHGQCIEVARRILDDGNVITIPGRAFGEQGSGYLRLSFAAAEKSIVRGVRAIARVLGATR